MKLQKYPYKDAIAMAFLFDARQQVKKGKKKKRRIKTRKVNEKADREEKTGSTE